MAAGIPELGSAAVLLYRWTVVHESLTPAALSRATAETGISEHQSHQAMHSLLGACLLQEVPAATGDPGVRWQPVSPQAAGRLLSARDAALRAQEESLRTQRRQIQEQHDGLAALMPVYLQARQHAFPQGTIDHLPDKFAVRTLLTEVIGSCRSEVLVSKHGGSFPVAALREALPRDLALLERGIRMRSLYQHATRFDQPTRTHAEQLVAAGAQIRTLPEALPQMIIVDQALALLPARSGGALIIREPDLLAYLLDVFERDWANATPYATDPHAAQGVSQTRKQTILVMLAKGLKDDTIARRLGISLRTCRRHVSELLESLGAHSRFEAGVIAERPGLTHHPTPPPPGHRPRTPHSPHQARHARPAAKPSPHDLKAGPRAGRLATAAPNAAPAPTAHDNPQEKHGTKPTPHTRHETPHPRNETPLRAGLLSVRGRGQAVTEPPGRGTPASSSAGRAALHGRGARLACALCRAARILSFTAASIAARISSTPPSRRRSPPPPPRHQWRPRRRFSSLSEQPRSGPQCVLQRAAHRPTPYRARMGPRGSGAFG
ncbi:LuxR C-terminal-related transcriptional regulator [Streptomyces sp. NBC_01006]|uniref:helix-turn-helix transcriptional regulator n=1 Tax=Streptomyces sp. NBC_01006 TaxID=2903716 RepID=UPI0038683B62|nr:LuxR C-terminal-related transcriptional regulator [Streptomyces sp. NBC_01006]